MNYELETILADAIILYIFYRFLMKNFYQNNDIKEVIENISDKIEDIVDQHNVNFFKNLYLKQKVEYLLMVIQYERDEMVDKTKTLYKLILEYKEFEIKEKEYVQINEDKEHEIASLKEKNKRLVKIMFKFLVSFESEIEEFKTREKKYKIKEDKFIRDREEFNFLSLE